MEHKNESLDFSVEITLSLLPFVRLYPWICYLISLFLSHGGIQTLSLCGSTCRICTKLPEIIIDQVSGATCKLYEHPFDTIKVLMQVNPKVFYLCCFHIQGVYRNSFDCLKKTVSLYGFKGLFRVYVISSMNTRDFSFPLLGVQLKMVSHLSLIAFVNDVWALQVTML